MIEKSVFISYSHDSDEHKKRVLNLAARLREDGILPLLDRYVDKATHVICICTEIYYRRFLGLDVPGGGKGADWEGALMTQALYDARSVSNKFLPAFFDSADEANIPEPLRGRSSYALGTEAGYQALYDSILGESGIVPPPMGELRSKSRHAEQLLGVKPVEISPHTACGSPRALNIWLEKMDFLLVEDAVCVDPNMKFRIKHLIKEAEDKIRLLRQT